MQKETNVNWVEHIQNWQKSGLTQSADCQKCTGKHLI